MFQAQLTTRAKDWFLDRKAVQERVDMFRLKALGKAGAFTRRKARDLVRRGKKPSAPGKPPKSHSPEPNLRTVWFAYDPATDSMVVGPQKLNQVNIQWNGEGRVTIPELMEHGGEIAIHEEAFKSSPDDWSRRDLRASRRQWKLYRVRRAKYPARPYMHPALSLAMADVPPAMRDLL